MLDTTSVIPFAELDDFFFNEILGAIHPALHHYLTDLRFIHHQEESHHIQSVQELWPDFNYYYMCLTWFVQDVFGLSDEKTLILGKALLLDFIDSILTDNVVDNQLIGFPAISLVINHIRQAAIAQFRQVFASDSAFWDTYAETAHAIWNAFAHEIHCVDKQDAPYTMDDFLKVCAGKQALYARQIAAMGYLSGKHDLIEPLQKVYLNLFIADGLIDDVGDWEDDAHAKRRTLPIVLVMQAANIPVETFAEAPYEAVVRVVRKSEVLRDLVDKACDYLEEGLAILSNLNLENELVAQVLQTRLDNAKDVRIRLARVWGLDMFIRAMKNE